MATACHPFLKLGFGNLYDLYYLQLFGSIGRQPHARLPGAGGSKRRQRHCHPRWLDRGVRLYHYRSPCPPCAQQHRHHYNRRLFGQQQRRHSGGSEQLQRLLTIPVDIGQFEQSDCIESYAGIGQHPHPHIYRFERRHLQSQGRLFRQQRGLHHTNRQHHGEHLAVAGHFRIGGGR